MAKLISIEVPSFAEHAITGSYGTSIVQHRNVEWRIEFGKRFTKALRNGLTVDAVADVPAPVKVKAMDGYLVYLKPAFDQRRGKVIHAKCVRPLPSGSRDKSNNAGVLGSGLRCCGYIGGRTMDKISRNGAMTFDELMFSIVIGGLGFAALCMAGAIIGWAFGL